MDVTEARALLGLARRDPRAALERGAEVLEAADEDDFGVRAVAYRAMALAAREGEGAEVSMEFGEKAVAAAEKAGDQRLRVEALMTLAGSQAMSGDNDSALATLERADVAATGHLAAEVQFQKGSIRARMGDTPGARRLFSEALPVFREHGDQESVAMTLHNRGMLNLFAGDLGQAIADFERAREIYDELDLDTSSAFVQYNIGVVTAFMGDIPRALQMLDGAEETFLEFTESAAEVQVARIEVLLTAGLFTEAKRLAERVSEQLQRLGLGEDYAEAVLVGALASRLSGDTAESIRLARRAEEIFEEQGRSTWKTNAAQVELGARLDAGEVSPADVGLARELADSLERAGHSDAAFNARLNAGLVALEVGLRHEAAADLRAIATESGGPVQRRLSSALARALVLELEGDPEGAEAAAMAGMDLLDEYQAVLGASDVRAGVERHAAELGDLGLRLAASAGDTPKLLTWMERTRARSTRYRPIRTAADAPYAPDLAALRQVESSLRTASDQELAELLLRKEKLEESVRRRSWHVAGTDEVIGLGPVAGELHQRLEDITLLEFAAIGPEVWRVEADARRMNALPMASSLLDVEREMEWHRFAMRALSRRGGDIRQATAAAEAVDEMLFADLEIETEDVVVVPVPSSYAFSWAALPSLRDRKVVVSPSAEIWAMRRSASADKASDRVVVIGGPDLEFAESEVREVSGVHGQGHTVCLEMANVAAALDALDGAHIAHVASHARFVVDNPMFSSLRLADGELYVYDIEQLRSPPEVVVLSACDSGFSRSRAGEELLGLTSALLSIGTRAVIASVGLVPDSPATSDLMVDLHEGLVAGLEPASALANAQARAYEDPVRFVSAASFICVGA